MRPVSTYNNYKILNLKKIEKYKYIGREMFLVWSVRLKRKQCIRNVRFNKIIKLEMDSISLLPCWKYAPNVINKMLNIDLFVESDLIWCRNRLICSQFRTIFRIALNNRIVANKQNHTAELNGRNRSSPHIDIFCGDRKYMCDLKIKCVIEINICAMNLPNN